jgi:hypothetical protein
MHCPWDSSCCESFFFFFFFWGGGGGGYPYLCHAGCICLLDSFFRIAGFLGVISMLVLSLHKKLHLGFALLSLMAGSAGIAIADVTIDACVTQNSITHPSLAGDMQSLCGLSSSIGALVGFSLSGFFVHLIGPKVSFCSTHFAFFLLITFIFLHL